MLKKGSVVIAFTTFLSSIAAMASNDEKSTFGWVERATVEPWGIQVKAKLDSGALTSSMHAEDIEEFERDGENWVRFKLRLKDLETEEIVSRTVEKPVHRRLVLHGAGGKDRRPAVLMELCIGGTVREEQFSLRDRGHMNYPVLLGRRTIQNLGTVDVTRTYLHEPACSDDAPVLEQADKNLDEDIGARSS